MTVELVRAAVRDWMTAFAPPSATVSIACSGGADSLALAAAAFAELDEGRLDAVTVDHQLQGGSADRAVTTAAQLHEIGYRTVRIETVTVGSVGGLEAAARAARYQALRPDPGGLVLLAHTADDQAETVLLGLGRGSGPRSIAGMAPWRAPWGRPFLGLRRTDTEKACREAGLTYWDDPQNVDPAFTRVRLRREVLPLLEDVLGGGVTPALARTATMLAEDLQALDHLAARVLADVWQPGGAVEVTELVRHPVALRRRALRAWADAVGAKALTADHLYRLDSLVTGTRRSGAVRLPGALDAVRTGPLLRAVPAG
ncbi:tRNA(Ile)-lysidine synthase [Nakamurella panacisegetis]|uniref:tRNA(Ile)-lysidine synthase n=1 Tax=Nakamurella panacisegetis TaxID=1090615 RepID=A0A1H0NNE9_9ACTN|nr:tRNA lysidine(34) synthetase TilS [Nakamurella panacisegetis]SDO94234.1 tRNA(Ile)-lysidine synthase [Nakamurella panacisegetis]